MSAARRLLLAACCFAAAHAAVDLSLVRLDTVDPNCPSEFFRAAPLLWPCGRSRTEGSFNLQAQAGSPDTFIIPRGVKGFVFTLEASSAIAFTVENRTNRLAGHPKVVLKAPVDKRSPSVSLPMMMISVRRSNTLDGFKATMLWEGQPDSSLVVKLAEPSFKVSGVKVTFEFDYVEAAPCPQAPVGCEKYSDHLALTALDSWSCWAQTRYGNAYFAWAIITGSLGSSRATVGSGGMSASQWGNAWMEAPASMSFDASLPFTYLDSNLDRSIGFAEFSSEFSRCKIWTPLQSGNDTSPVALGIIALLVFFAIFVIWIYSGQGQKPEEGQARDLEEPLERAALLKEQELALIVVNPKVDPPAPSSRVDCTKGYRQCTGYFGWGAGPDDSKTRPPPPMPPERFKDIAYTTPLLQQAAVGAAAGVAVQASVKSSVPAVPLSGAFARTPRPETPHVESHPHHPQDLALNETSSWDKIKAALESSVVTRQVEALNMITQRCGESVQAQDAAMNELGAAAVLVVLEEHPESVQVQTAGCAAVFRMLDQNPAYAGKFAHDRAVETLVAVLKGHYKEAEISELALWSLQGLTCAAEGHDGASFCCQELLDAGGFEYVALAFETHMTDAGAAEAASFLVASLGGCHTVRDKLTDRVAQLLPQALNQHIEDEGVVEAVCRAIVSCSSSRAVAEKLRTFGAATLLEKAARQHKDSPVVTTIDQALQALRIAGAA